MATVFLSAPTLLDLAHERLQTGDLVGAGCYCRAALHRHLREWCQRHGCLPYGRRLPATDYAKALCRAGVFTESQRGRITRLLLPCNRASFVLLRVSPRRLRDVIESARLMVAESVTD